MAITSNFESFMKTLENNKMDCDNAIEQGLNKTCTDMVKNATDFTIRVDTATLKKSWEINGEQTINEDGLHQKQVWSSPNIIATNPKHPNGDYYSNYIENGWTDRGGIWHEGDHMLQSSVTIAKHEITSNIKNELNKINK